jgi:Leucine-rich repeat (LRR) protein
MSLALTLSRTVLETNFYSCSYEDLMCQMSNLTMGDNDSLNISQMGDKVRDIHTISFQQSKLVTFPTNFFAEFSNIVRLTAENCGIQHLTIKTPVYKLNTLRLPHNRLTVLTAATFTGASNLVFIDLSDNLITEIEENTFHKLDKLEEICLSQNKLVQLKPNTFLHQVKLVSVLVSDNKISSIEEALFQGTPSLVEFELNNNNISALTSAKIFEKQTKLTTLSLAGNQISGLPDGILANLKYLVDLDLSRNRLTSIDLNQLSFSQNLKNLNLDFNEIKVVHSNALQNVSFSTLSLAHNRIRDLSWLKAAGFVALERLSLSINPLRIDNSTFLQFEKITKLNLSAVTLTRRAVEGGMFSRLAELQELDISNNRLQHIDLNSFFALKRMKKLYLSGNNLDEIKGIGAVKQILPALHQLEISNNNWNCSYLTVMVQQLITFNIHILFGGSTKVTNTSNIEGVSCLNKTIDVASSVGSTIAVNTDMERLKNTLVKLKADSDKWNSKVLKWLTIQSCVLAFVCLYVIFKLLIYVKPLFRKSMKDNQRNFVYLTNDECTL